jgi:hypothetical protein
MKESGPDLNVNQLSANSVEIKSALERWADNPFRVLETALWIILGLKAIQLAWSVHSLWRERKPKIGVDKPLR